MEDTSLLDFLTHCGVQNELSKFNDLSIYTLALLKRKYEKDPENLRQYLQSKISSFVIDEIFDSLQEHIAKPGSSSTNSTRNSNNAEFATTKREIVNSSGDNEKFLQLQFEKFKEQQILREELAEVKATAKLEKALAKVELEHIASIHKLELELAVLQKGSITRPQYHEEAVPLTLGGRWSATTEWPAPTHAAHNASFAIPNGIWAAGTVDPPANGAELVVMLENQSKVVGFAVGQRTYDVHIQGVSKGNVYYTTNGSTWTLCYSGSIHTCNELKTVRIPVNIESAVIGMKLVAFEKYGTHCSAKFEVYGHKLIRF